MPIFASLSFLRIRLSLYSKSQNPSFTLTLSNFSTKALENPNQKPFINYLVQNLNFSKTLANSIYNRFSSRASTEKPASVVRCLKGFGLSDAQIGSAVRVCPQLLFTNVSKILKPKLDFFEELGLVGSDLGKFLSKNSSVLVNSLSKRLKPNVELLKRVLRNDMDNKNLILVSKRCSWLLCVSGSELSRNIAFFENCGIKGAQLGKLLIRQPRLFTAKESTLNGLLSDALRMGFSLNSRMLVYGIYSISCVSKRTLERKLGVLKKYGFMENECMMMFTNAPSLLRSSEEKIVLGIEFFLNVLKFKKEVLVARPICLLHSMEERVLPRYRVLEILKSKGLLKKELKFVCVLSMTEKTFLNRFILKFRDIAEELLIAYKTNHLNLLEE